MLWVQSTITAYSKGLPRKSKSKSKIKAQGIKEKKINEMKKGEELKPCEFLRFR